MVRFKNRYLLGEIIPFRQPTAAGKAGETSSNVGFTKEEMFAVIKDSIKHNFGDYGLGLLYPALQVKYFSAGTGSFILRCARPYFRMLWAAITLVTQIGTIRTCQLELLRINRSILKEEDVSAPADEMDVDD